MANRALIYGRFQPFHLGHLSLVKWSFDQGFDEVAILIGMASENYTPRNPFTAGERIEMVRLSLKDSGIGLDRIITATIPTLEISIGCAYYVLSYIPKVKAILTRNPVISKAFSDAGTEVIIPPRFNRNDWRGEVIRQLMSKGDDRWKRLVTPSVVDYINEIGGVERVKKINSED
ncbi:MAG: nicotinamide-nucleotide adenylyltransferase [Caldisphaeraceae archaeon]|nr:nicotinamide-nucleotide adenylyltransferase [Caldisphaeraceae archaeon]MCE4623696.1 nicotinamide-nucleotide adenylyltransferase [Caldisphaeraceae archaeon]MEB2792886.1 nicotinamide-nucleotide adenylyltransferase [Caldisphaeraceae archaeon]MEB3692340.1 nicotinamide-nucleotide adenylyltransferase [Caldisphaeraceae archaeon]MEB3798326.1 nicotinamide-nucleotide adenylyltransferase [Caldisphaeraceae archaeon]